MSNANNRGWTCASCLTQRTTEWVETDKLRADLDEAMRQRAHWMEEARRYCKNNEDACAEVERLRAEANARAVEELHRVQQWVMENRVPAFGSTHMAVTCAQVKSMVADRIAELSKPAAKESEPVKDEPAKCWSCDGHGYIGTTSGIPGMIGYAHNSCSRCGGTGKLVDLPREPDATCNHGAVFDLKWVRCSRPRGHHGSCVIPKPEEPAKDGRLGDWPLSDYVADYNPATASPLETAVYHLCRKAMGMTNETRDTGAKEAYREVMMHCFRRLAGKGDDLIDFADQRCRAVSMLRQVCEAHGDNDWPDDLDLSDVIEKHLWRHLEQGK